MKKFVSFVLCIALVLSGAYVTAFSADREIVQSGKFKDNIEWVIYTDGELVLSGKGAVYEMNEYPWTQYFADCKVWKVTITEGITEISGEAFSMSRVCYINTYSFPKSIKNINPKSLYIKDTGISDGKLITAVCYAGSKNEWEYVEGGSRISGLKAVIMYCNGEEAKPFCRFVESTKKYITSGTVNICVQCYRGKLLDSTVSYVSDNEKIRITDSSDIFVRVAPEGLKGCTVTVSLCDVGGNVVSSDTIKLKPDLFNEFTTLPLSSISAVIVYGIWSIRIWFLSITGVLK